MRKRLLLLCLVGLACRHAAREHEAVANHSRVANLRAFAKLYGVVRWFYPGDTAATVDWDRFAIDGVRAIVDSPDAAGRRAVLAEIWHPVAPAVEITAAADPPRVAPSAPLTAGDHPEIVAWQHRGFGDSTFATVYASKRLHHERVVPAPGVPFAALWQAVDATPFRGRRVRLTGKLRTSGRALGQLWIRVERGNSTGFFDNMDARPVVSQAWQRAEVVGTVDADATRLIFGSLMSSGGTVWYDDLELAVEAPDGAWMPVVIRDPGFELANPLASWSPGIGNPRFTSVEGWNVTLDHENPASGRTSLRVEAGTKVLTEELFSESPTAGEVTDIELGGGLRARVPLTLQSKAGRTVDEVQAEVQDKTLAARAHRTPHLTVGYDALAGVADVIVLWNVLEHFWPYWQDVSVDWSSELDAVLRDALDDRSIDDHVATLQRLLVAAPDGHARVTCPGETSRSTPPFSVDLVEGQVVVTTSADSAIMRGDVVVAVDGESAAGWISATRALISGSLQWRAEKARDQFAAGPPGSWVNVRIRRGNTHLDVKVERNDKSTDPIARAAIERLEDGVYYVDLSRAPTADLDQWMSRLASAPGVVFDVRDRPLSNHKVLSHLVDKAIDFSEAMYIPHIIRPGHTPASIPSWETEAQILPPLQPRIAGRVAFLTGPRAISYAESVISLVAHHRLAAIVGSSTAGANGNVAEVTTPTNCRARFTGLRVTKQDGSRFHLVGIQPTIPVTRTIAGVRAGRDEVLERALAYVRNR
ncbi:MAG: hypothetical protein H7138_19905 [Myxococcales bacterium]|nr:hypothetical protein [Myxococcales bacterium]